MENNRNSADEPFFWIKTGRNVDNHIPQKLEGVINRKKRVILPLEKSSPPSLPVNQNETARAGLQAGWIRASFIVREEYLKRLKEKAYWDRKAIKEVLDEILKTGLAGNPQKKQSE